MTVKKFFQLVRYDLTDMNRAKFSDHELLDSTNAILKLINNALIKMRSNLILKTTTLTMNNDYSSLPNDFISVVYVQDTNTEEELFPQIDYQIEGDNIYYDDGTSVLFKYRYYFGEVNLNDEMPTPNWMTELMRKFVVMVLAKQISKTDDSLSQMIYRDISSALSGREYSVIERPMQFFV